MNKKIKLARMNPELAANEIGDFILEQILGCGRVGGIVGLSGGVDSTTTAALAKRAFDRFNKENSNPRLELVSYILPSKINNLEDEKDGKRVAEKLSIRYEVISIEPIVEAYRKTNPSTFNSSYNRGNLISEIRATVLHAKAATENKLVLGTGNKDEDFSVAYYTLFGDGAVHLSPIGNLSKRLVREMAVYLGFPESAKRTPAPGLEPGQTSFKDLGYRYDTAELVINGFEQGLCLEEILADDLFTKSSTADINEYVRIYGQSKFQNPREIILDVIKRNKIARAKAEIVHPPIAHVTLEYD